MPFPSKEKQQEYYKNNKEKIKQRSANWYLNNRQAKIEKVTEYRIKRRLRALKILGGACMICDENDPATLQFHHREPHKKRFNVSHALLWQNRESYPWDIIVEEIKKCDLLCANCHFKLHSKY